MWSAVSRLRQTCVAVKGRELLPFPAAMRPFRRQQQCNASTTTVSTMVGGRELSLRVGMVGPLADGVVYAKYGDTSLLVSAVCGWDMASADFLPLQVDFREKAFAGGIIPSTFTRREAAASDRETLAARIIDRSVRPLFSKGFFYDTQLICSIMSFDKDCDPSMLSVVAASAALQVSSIPWNGPCAAVRVGWVDGEPVVAPTYQQDIHSKLNLLYSGKEDKTLMLEIGAWELPEDKLIRALRFAHEQVQPLIQLQNELKAACGKEKKDLTLATVPPQVLEAVRELIWEDARSMYRQHHYKKAERGNAQRLLFIKIKEKLRDAFPSEMHRYFGQAGDTVMKAALRSVVAEAAEGNPSTYIHPMMGPPDISSEVPHLPQGDALAVEREVAGVASEEAVSEQAPAAAIDDPENAPDFEQVNAEGCRPDGRNTTDIRAISCEVDVLPLVHGSAVFTRGDTQVLCTTTLGPLDLAQMLRPLSGDIQKKQFFLHYDFPPYCTNEVGKVGGSNRRMVGHGALAEKALVPVMPDENEFPFTIRATSEVTGSDGSSSMATVCGACLSLLDAGVPLKAPVAGISIGTFTPKDTEFYPGGPQTKYHLLTDIFGLEDHSGDMDFKVAGTRFGVTAAQLDVKPAGLPLEVLEQALWRAKIARLKVLDKMAAVLPRARSEMKPSAPRIEQMVIPQELVGKLIGPGGSNVKKIMSATGAKVQIDSESPTVSVYATAAALESAKNMIHSALDEHRRMIGSPLSLITSPSAPVLTVGQAVTCKVLKVHDFGVVLGSDNYEVGWMHISEFAPKRTTKVTDLMNEGDELTAMVVDVDVRGRGKFSIRALMNDAETDASKYIVRKSMPVEPIVVPETRVDLRADTNQSVAQLQPTPTQPITPAESKPAPEANAGKVETAETVRPTNSAMPAGKLKYALSVTDLLARMEHLLTPTTAYDDETAGLIEDNAYSYLSSGARQGVNQFVELRREVHARSNVRLPDATRHTPERARLHDHRSASPTHHQHRNSSGSSYRQEQNNTRGQHNRHQRASHWHAKRVAKQSASA